MFKEVPGNANYVINLNGQIKRKDGRECTLPSSDTTVQMTLFKQKRWVAKEWLAMMAHFEVKLYGHHGKYFGQIEFEDVPQETFTTICGKRMVLHKPIYVGKDFRLVPGLLNVAVCSTGRKVLECVDGKWIEVSLTDGVYKSVWVRDPDRSRRRSIGIHRLVALAWVVNPEPDKFNIVNHKDGNKHNNHHTNLEWCDYGQNNRHARDSGLWTQTKPCRVLDFETEEVYRFPSTSEACFFMGLNRTNLRALLGVKERKLIKGRYELRLADDDRIWSKPEDFKVVKGRYIITVTLVDGSNVIYSDIRDLKKDFKLWNVNASIDKFSQRLSELNPGVTMTWIDQHVTGPYQAKRVTNGEVLEADSLGDLAALCGISKAAATSAVKQDCSKVTSGYLIRVKTDEPWPEELKYYGSLPKCILATHPANGELTFVSLRKAAEHFNVDKTVISVRLKNGQPYKHWTFREITKH